MTTDSIESRIAALKEQRNAVILVHNYQIPEVQDIADYTGDSLGLSRQAAATDADVIVFCGVTFMAETASILSPQKTVLMPDKNAGCPMADMITVEQLDGLKESYPDALVVCYVNSSADVKAASDYCCTSANAIDIVRAMPEDRDIIFVPDKYLGRYVAAETGRDLVLWNGYCPTHMRITEADIIKSKEQHPDALVMVHPECTEPVCDLADEILSTGGMWHVAANSDSDEFIVGTEVGMIYRLEQDNPGKKFYPASEKATCPNMKRINLEKVLWSLEDMKYEVKVPEETRAKALRAVDRMLEVIASGADAS
jgi:quinolinate synthase